jgi:hypothetical protein
MADVLIARRSVMVSLAGTPHKVRQGSLAHPDAEVVGLCPDVWESLSLSLDYPAPTPEPVASAEEPAPKDVRAWARDQGIDVPARGKVPDDVVEQYKAAQDA